MNPPKPSAVAPMITIRPANAEKSVSAADISSNVLFHLNQMRALSSVCIIGKPLTLTATMPPAFAFTWYDGFPVATRKTSTAIDG